MASRRGTCGSCGADIWWWDTQHGKTYPPLIPAHKTVLAEVNGEMHSAAQWDLHRCPNEYTEAYMEKMMASYHIEEGL